MTDLATQTIDSEFTEWIIRLMIDGGFMQPQLGMVVRLKGQLEPSRLTRAIRLLMDEEPVLGCRFVEEGRRPYWERLDSLDSLDLLPVVETSDAQVESDAFGWIALEIDPCEGPQLTARLYRAPAGDLLALKFNHVAVDGNSVKEGAYLLAETYRRLEATPDYTPPPNTGVRNIVPAAKGASLRQKWRALRPAELASPTDWGFPAAGRGRGASTQIVHRIGPEAFREMRAWSRTRSATVNDLLLAAYFRTLVHVLCPGPGARTPVQQSCDFRPWMPVDERTALSNIAGIWSVNMCTEDCDSFLATLAKIVERTRAWKESDAGISTALQTRLARRMPYRTFRDKAGAHVASGGSANGYPTMTNIGVIDDRQLDFGDPAVEDAFVLGPIAYPPGFVLTATTFRDRLTLSAGFDRAALDSELAQSVLDGVVMELANALPNAWEGLPA